MEQFLFFFNPVHPLVCTDVGLITVLPPTIIYSFGKDGACHHEFYSSGKRSNTLPFEDEHN
jgi:hypothetical protein